MLVGLNKSSTHRLPLQNAMRVQVIFLEKFGRKICGDISYRYIVNAKKSYGLELSIFGSWFMVFLNFWLVVIPVERFLVRGGSW